MDVTYVNHRGEPVSLDPRVGAKLKAQRDAPATYHKGWSVEGHLPGSLEAAQKAAEDAFADWHRQPEESRAKRLTAGERAPKPWNEAAWRQGTKRKKVRARPFEIPSSAEECKALAERSGWIEVVVIELKKARGE